MIQCKCIEKFRDSKGNIVAYRLMDSNLKTQDITPQLLKQAIKNNQLDVVNLKLTSDNRLIDKKENVQTDNVKISSKDLITKLAKDIHTITGKSKYISNLSLEDYTYIFESNLHTDNKETTSSIVEIQITNEFEYCHDNIQPYIVLKISVNKSRLKITQYICETDVSDWRRGILINYKKDLIDIDYTKYDYKVILNNIYALLENKLKELKTLCKISKELNEAIDTYVADLGNYEFGEIYESNIEELGNISKFRDAIVDKKILSKENFDKFVLSNISLDSNLLNYISNLGKAI